MEVVKVNDLIKHYKSKRKKVKALNKISFTVKEGEILGFLGPNGAGKSTTIKILMDLIRADSGTAQIFNIDSKNPQSRKEVGFMPENPQYYDSFTGLDLLLFSASFFKISKKTAKKRAWELLEEFDLKEAAKRPLRKYSKGMIQRIGFASTLIHDPKILILDEPMSGLDPIGRVLFKNKMIELHKKGVTIFFSSHIIPDIEDICTRVLIVKKGQVIKSLEKAEIKYLTTTGFKIIISNKIDINMKIEKITDELFSLYCPKDKLINTLEELKTKNVKIIDIEPLKKNLEDIFVEITQQN